MKGILQRVSQAEVKVDGETVGRIGHGLLLFLAVEKGDGTGEVENMARKVAGLRIFADGQGRMQHAVAEGFGAVLAISQFTLAADLKKGFRPSFSNAEIPEKAEALFNHVCDLIQATGVEVARGQFGADMQVHLVNNGPVTFWLDFPPPCQVRKQARSCNDVIPNR